MQISQVKKGSVVKIWHHPRGHDYVVAGYNPTKKHLNLVKLNCLNNDGNVHASTSKFHKHLKYTKIGSKYVVKGVNKILGSRDLDDSGLARLNDDNSNKRLPVSKIFHCSPIEDSTQVTNYNPQ